MSQEDPREDPLETGFKYLDHTIQSLPRVPQVAKNSLIDQLRDIWKIVDKEQLELEKVKTDLQLAKKSGQCFVVTTGISNVVATLAEAEQAARRRKLAMPRIVHIVPKPDDLYARVYRPEHDYSKIYDDVAAAQYAPAAEISEADFEATEPLPPSPPEPPAPAPEGLGRPFDLSDHFEELPTPRRDESPSRPKPRRHGSSGVYSHISSKSRDESPPRPTTRSRSKPKSKSKSKSKSESLADRRVLTYGKQKIYPNGNGFHVFCPACTNKIAVHPAERLQTSADHKVGCWRRAHTDWVGWNTAPVPSL